MFVVLVVVLGLITVTGAASAGATTANGWYEGEEIYYILSGKGRMTIDGEERDVKKHDGIAIFPEARHKITNTGTEDLVFLCCCAPAYEHDDTVMTE